MQIRLNFAALRQTSAREYGIRFLFGGAITAATGLIAHAWGASVAGLFLAFPAILPASVTLVEAHERRRKRRAGYDGTRRGRAAAALTARGASRGSAGLAAFGLVCWRLWPRYPVAPVLAAALLVWLATALTAWKAHSWLPGKRRH